MLNTLFALACMFLGWSQQVDGPANVLASRPVSITVGRGELVQFSDETSRVSVSDPTIADAVVVSPHEVVLNGKTPGNTTIMVWHGGNISPFRITVDPDLTDIQKQLQTAFPTEHIVVSSSKDAILLSGVVTDVEISRQAATIAGAFTKNVVNLIQSPPPDNRQVLLQVKFATMDRTTLSQLGVNIFSTNNKLIGALTTQQFSFPRPGPLQVNPANGVNGVGNQTVTISDVLNLFAFRPDIGIGATVRLLQNNNLLEVLAEPNLITVSGHEASFLAGGEFPFPVISSTGTGAQAAPVVTIQFKEFGVRLFFTPTVQGNGVIHLKVRPEVSALDFANALTIQGFQIPAISTRRAETEVDLHEGESFAIAGLLDNRVTQVMSKIPGIGDMPVIGRLFRSRDTQKANTELLVLITPNFVKPFAPGETPSLPPFPEKFLGNEPPAPQPTFIGPRGRQGPGGK
jgi:pilus assembly protein CpaC